MKRKWKTALIAAVTLLILSPLIAVGVTMLAIIHEMQPKPLRIPQVDTLKSRVRAQLPALRNFTVEYPRSKDIYIDLQGYQMPEEEVFAFVLLVRDMAMDPDFKDTVMEKLDLRDIRNMPFLYIRVYDRAEPFSDSKYEFSAGWFFELYNSGMHLEEYTYNGYQEWRGYESHNPVPNIYMCQIEAGAKKVLDSPPAS